MSETPVLSIVIVNSDGASDTLNCLASIERCPPQGSFEVIVVDNQSEMPGLSLVQQRFPQVRTYSAPMRQGFAKNYNLGMRQAHGQYVMILNNDTIIHAGALANLLEAMRQHPEYGMAGPQLLSADGQIQSFCARPLLTPASHVLNLLFLDLGLPIGKLVDAYRRWRLARQPSGPTPCICGACMLLTRAALDQVGLLDEVYDFYFEDIEWCHRIQRRGLQVGYIAEAKITHLGDQSLSKVKEWAKRSEYLGALHYFRQYYQISLGRARLVWLATAMAFLMRFTLFKIKELITRQACYASEYARLLPWIWSKYPVAVSADEITLAGENRSPA